MKKKIIILCIFSSFLFNCFSEIYFDNLNINNNDELLYSVTKKSSNKKLYSTLFLHKIQKGKSVGSNESELPKILTCYPEKMTVVDNGKKIQITNSYGSAIYDFEKKSIDWNSLLNFDNEFSIVQPSFSPDSKWIVYFKKIGASKAQLIIEESITKKSFVLDKEADYNLSGVPVKWSDDSKNLIYQKNNNLYFCNLESLINNYLIDEKYRKIGSGKINCVQWVNSQTFCFIDFDIVYLFRAKDFSSLGIYTNIFSIGKVIGRLPDNYEIDNFEFLINKAANEILIIKNNAMIYYYQVNDKNQTSYLTLLNSQTYGNYFDSSFNTKVFWSNKSKPIICTNYVNENGKIVSCAYSFDSKNQVVKLTNSEIILNGQSNIAFSADGKFFAYASEDVVYIYKVDDWTVLDELKAENVISLAFRNNFELCIGGQETVELYDVLSKKSEILFLSQAQNATWDSYSNNVICNNKNNDSFFVFNSQLNNWQVAQNVNPLPIKIQNSNFRVYKAQSKNIKFANGIYIRNLSKDTNTFALYKEVLQKNQKQKKISLVFDLIDNASGVNEIIALAEKYNLKVTYFFNGEFIRRYPAEAKKIALTNAEIGSMFYTNIDLTAKEFDITKDYIKRGLARNEDEFFECTGKELSLLWHAPFYKSSKLIRDAGFEAGYNYVDFPTEMESFDSKAGKKLESQIIPITVGLSSNGQRKVFYNKLELLILSLLEANYDIVPISEL